MSNQISGSDYVNLLLSLREVSQETGVELNNAKSIDVYHENTALREQMALVPPFSLDTVVSQVKGFIKGKKAKLIVYEAASRVGLNRVAMTFLNQWQAKLVEKVNEKCGQARNSFPMGFRPQINKEETDAKLQAITQALRWPTLRNPQVALHEIINSVSSDLATELVFRKFHPAPTITDIPPHIVPLCNQRRLTDIDQYLIERYVHLRKNVSLSGLFSASVGDESVKVCLNRFPQLESLDLTGCIYVTPACLSVGHPTLKGLNLTGTRITESDVPKQLFPQLQVITQTDVVSVFDLDSVSDSMSWQDIATQAENANKIFYSRDGLERLLSRFTANPTEDGVKALLAINNHALNAFNFDFGLKMVNALLDAWRGAKDNATGAALLQVLLTLWTDDRNKKGRPAITSAIVDELCVMNRVMKHDRNYGREVETKEIKHVTQKDVQRIRTLAQMLRAYNWPGFKDIFETIKSQLDLSDSHLFHSKTASGKTRDSTVMAHELLAEIYVEMSHRAVPEMDLAFYDLKDPNKVTRRTRPFGNDSMVFFNLFLNAAAGETLHPGPLFKEVTDQSLACLFCVRVSDGEHRARTLQSVLTNFSDYVSPSAYYALPKIVLGVVKDTDIPEWDKDSTLVTHLMSYRGVFSEKISETLKESYWTALCEGKLGGKTKALVDALVDFHNKAEVPQEWKIKTITALKSIGGVVEGPLTGTLYHNPLSLNEVKAHAREKLKALLG